MTHNNIKAAALKATKGELSIIGKESSCDVDVIGFFMLLTDFAPGGNIENYDRSRAGSNTDGDSEKVR